MRRDWSTAAAMVRSLWRTTVLLTIGLGAVSFCSAGVAQEPDAAGLEFFEKKIRPVLVQHCYACHSGQTKTPQGGLRLDGRDASRAGGDSGHAVVPFDLEQSLLLSALRHESFEMPPAGPLSEDVIANFEAWITMGAPDPRDTPSTPKAAAPIDVEAGKQFWAFQTPRDTQPPQPADGWSSSAIDRFLAARHKQVGVVPVKDADRATLLRRVYFDLIGLPPTPDQLRDFLESDDPNAYVNVVDRLLDSPQFGERWGRHWLDVVRYAESTGRTRNFPYPFAWRYRDYVIHAFNQDLPFDQFVREQIAGDLQPADNNAQRDRQLIATGFLAIGAHDLNERNRDVYRMEVVAEQLDVVSRAIMGVTLSCARCHDHKFDPIPTEDYYALAGIFRSSELLNGYDARRRNRQRADGTLLVALSGEEAEVERLEEESLSGAYAMGVADARRIADCPIHLGGEVTELDRVVPRGYLQVVNVRNVPEMPDDQSGRLQLAQWLTQPDHPLTSRVIVNRVWKHLFGQGIVTTVDNFGVMGSRPSHPELLDYLATSFVEHGWSVKQLIRTLVTSRAYRLSGEYHEANHQLDPDNQLIWRMPLRRLEAEAIRDAILSISGQLEMEPPTGSIVQQMPVAPLRQRRDMLQQMREFPYRSVYLPIIRSRVPDYLTTFDFPEPSEVKGQRDVTTVAPQALFMMNSPMVQFHSRLAAERLLTQSRRPRELVQEAYLLTLSRLPTDDQLQRSLDYMFESTRDNQGKPRLRLLDGLTDVMHALFATAEFRYR
jgi:cytochrome c553